MTIFPASKCEKLLHLEQVFSFVAFKLSGKGRWSPSEQIAFTAPPPQFNQPKSIRNMSGTETNQNICFNRDTFDSQSQKPPLTPLREVTGVLLTQSTELTAKFIVQTLTSKKLKR